MKIKKDNYVCSVCGKRNVKLWRPFSNVAPLICAECAEERQTPIMYEEVIWKKKNTGGYKVELTGKKIKMPKWKVDENGLVPSSDGPGIDGKFELDKRDLTLKWRGSTNQKIWDKKQLEEIIK